MNYIKKYNENLSDTDTNKEELMTTITLNINNLNGTTLCGRGIPMGLMF